MVEEGGGPISLRRRGGNLVAPEAYRPGWRGFSFLVSGSFAAPFA